MEEPKAVLPNGHSESHSEDKPEQMEVDEVETKMKDDANKTDTNRTKSTDSEEATNSSPKTKAHETEKTTHHSFENALMQIEKSSIKKKVPQKIVKRSPRISRNKEPPEKDGETSKTEEKAVEKKTEEEKGETKKEDEVKKEESGEVMAKTNEGKKESAAKKEVEKKDDKATEAKKAEVQFIGDPDADFLGFDDPKTSNYTSARDKLQKMIDQLVATSSPVLVASTSGTSSRSRRSVKRDPAKEDQPKAGTSESLPAKTEAEPQTEAGNDENRSRRSRPSQVASSERKPSPTVNKRNFDVSLPQYLKPFEYGWKRELAYRNNTENFSKRMADIFYYTPLGKKIRSIGQVKDYLLGTDLTLENFTFVTKAMNLNDPNKETIRDNRKNVINKPVTPQMSPVTTRKSAALSRTNSAESAGDNAEETPKASTAAVTPKISLKSFRPPPKNKTNKTPVPEKKSKKSSDDSDNDKDELEMGMLPPLWNESIRPDWSANGSPAVNKNRSEEVDREREEEGEDKVEEVCSIRCARMRGQIPTLACVVCLCLYHPECVSSVRRNVLNYVCKNCQDAKNPAKKSGPTPIHSSPPPLVPISSSQSDCSQSETSTPQLQRLLDGGKPNQPSHKIVGGVTTWLPPSSMIHLTTKSMTTSKLSTTSQVTTVDSSTAGGATPAQTLWQMNGKRFLYVPKHNVLSVSPAANASSASSQSETQSSTAQSGNLVSPGCVSMPSLIQNTVQPSFLSSSLIGKPAPNMSHALIVSDTANPNSNSGVLLVPCITTTTAAAGALASSGGDSGTQRILLVNGAGGLPATNFLIGNMSAQTQQLTAQQPSSTPPDNESEKSATKRPLETNKPEPETAIVSPPAKRSKKEPEAVASDAASDAPVEPDTPKSPAPVDPVKPDTPKAPDTPVTVPVDPVSDKAPVTSVPASSSVSVNKEFFMTNVSAIYHALLNSFQYLKVQELLRAARVCHMWRDVAMNRSLWHVVRMKNSRVRDWDGLANTLRQTGTRHLDLRKMLMPDKSEEVSDMWTRYAAAIERVNSLWRVDLCRCPAAAVESSARANTRLQYLAALAIKSSSLDASAFENCRNMTELRLKSSEKNGLDLENLSALKHLTKMKHLSLTTMKSFAADLADVLENMKDLETLELGECSELSESVATKALPKLKRLQRLRLEKGQGQECPTLAVLNAVKDLKQLVQLELINFDIKAGFDTTIAKCTNLRTLLVIPTYVTQSATTNHLVMEGVSKLSKTLTLFVWGITLELLRVTDLFIDQWEGQKGAVKSANAKKGSGDSIPILKPLSETSKKEAGAPSQVDILQLPKLHKVLTSLLPTTKVKILKVPFSATWRQTVSGPAHIH